MGQRSAAFCVTLVLSGPVLDSRAVQASVIRPCPSLLVQSRSMSPHFSPSHQIAYLKDLDERMA